MPPSNPRPSHAPPSVVRLFLWLWILLAWGPLVGRAQNLVTNPGFFGGELTGWQGNPGYIGYVPSPGGAWIGLSGELYQDLTTEPGASYTIEFSVQRFDPQQSWRPNSLEVSWNNQRVARFDFVESDTRWVRIRYFVRSTGTVTRLRFRGIEFPSLDNISVTRSATGFATGAMALPLDGTQSLEGDPIPLRSLWTSEGGASLPSTTTFLLGGIVPLVTASQAGGQANAVWTNPPPGVHFIAASAPGGYQTPPVRIVVVARPKLRQVAPLNRQFFAPNTPVALRADLVDNTGTDTIQTVRILIDGEVFARVAPTAGRVQSAWTTGAEGSHTLEFIGETANGRDIAQTKVLIHVLPTGERDVLQTAEGATETFGTEARIAQTFTAGFHGRLVSVGLVGTSNSGLFDNPLEVEILDVDPINRNPGTNILGSTRVTLLEAINASRTGQLHLAFPSNRIHLMAGRSYAVACRYIAPAGEQVSLRTSFIDALPGGQLWRQSGAGWIPATMLGGPVVGHDIQMTTWMVPVPGPSASIRTPAPLAGFAAGEGIPIQVEATPGISSNEVQRITFLANGLEIGSLTSPPYAFTWTNPPIGNHVLQAAAIDVNGYIGWSTPISVLSGVDATHLPRLRVEDAASPEGNSSLPPLVFPVTLSAPAAAPVTVQFNTRNLDAVAGVDYVEASGVLTFAPGQTQAFVFVRMVADARDKRHRSFQLDLRLPEGAVLDRPSATGTILDDEPGSGKAFSYEWSGLPTPVRPGTPFNARLTARDLLGTAVASVPGGVTIGIVRETDAPQLFLGPSEPNGTLPETGFTAGLRFRPKVDLIATHLRSRAGGSAALRSDLGHIHAAATLPFRTGQWQEASLPHPVLLKAGTVYYLTLYVTVPGMPLGATGMAGLTWIEHLGQTVASGNAFPTQSGFMNPAVDFRFIPVESRPDLLPTIAATQFPDGTWEGPVNVTTAGPRLRLFASGLLGNATVSARLQFATPELWLASDPSASMPRFLLNVTGGYRFQVQASTNLHTWSDASPFLRSSGAPIPWEPTDPTPPTAFFRLIAVE